MPHHIVRLLYIDDDVVLGRLVQRILSRRGYEVECASDAEAGLARVEEGGIDVVVLDHDLGVASGLDVLSVLRQRESPPPVVYVTASTELSIAVEALKAGAVDYVVKTVGDDFEVLLVAAIEQSREKARLQREKERAEREVREARDRAVVLLAEVNHRVANSLALVSSLVRMQAATLEDSAAKAALAETQARITAIGKLHRSLYTSDDVRSVNVATYLQSILNELTESLASEGRTPTIAMRLDPVAIATDRAVSIGMIATELVTNAMKYAYPEGSGEVRVILTAVEDGGFVLTIEDDGVGWRGEGPRQGSGLGSRIVGSLVRTLGTELVYDPDAPGTRVSMRVAASEPRE
jgi:two-component sensor histidine kinase